MRRLACLFVLTSACAPLLAQTRAPPTVRYAYVLKGDAGVLSLKDNLIAIVCKAEYDAWVQGREPSAVSLYLNGMLMNGPEAVAPVATTDAQLPKSSDYSDPEKAKPLVAAKQECNEQAEKMTSPARADANEKSKEATAAKKAAESEPNKGQREALLVKSDRANVVAKDAAEKATSLENAYQQHYMMMRYYLDPQYVTKKEKQESWIRLLAQSGDVDVSVGPANGPPWPSNMKIEFERIHRSWLGGWSALFLAAIVLFVRYARRSDIIRDPGEPLPPVPGTPARMKAYSLARTQMAVWTFLVAGALAFIFLVTWNPNTISSGVLVLLGISFGTTLMAATVDQEAPSEADVALAEKKAVAAVERAATARAAADMDPANKPAAADTSAAAKSAADKLAALKAGIWHAPQPSKGFLSDLLSDGNGPSFHRFQMVLFTVVLVVIFVARTLNTLAMPEFDTTLLGLMGISSGTYLGFKLQGK